MVKRKIKNIIQYFINNKINLETEFEYNNKKYSVLKIKEYNDFFDAPLYCYILIHVKDEDKYYSIKAFPNHYGNYFYDSNEYKNINFLIKEVIRVEKVVYNYIEK